jgi:hypothetical protein
MTARRRFLRAVASSSDALRRLSGVPQSSFSNSSTRKNDRSSEWIAEMERSAAIIDERLLEKLSPENQQMETQK